MLSYTICFIYQGSSILLLNREKSSWMGMWNGVGGKIEKGESPLPSIEREVWEETGLRLENIISKGTITWSSGDGEVGGMYAFTASLSPDESAYPTPKKTDEGILDWKQRDWVMNPKNLGVATYLPHCLPHLLDDEQDYNFHCTYVGKELVSVERRPLD